MSSCWGPCSSMDAVTSGWANELQRPGEGREEEATTLELSQSHV